MSYNFNSENCMAAESNTLMFGNLELDKDLQKDPSANKRFP